MTQSLTAMSSHLDIYPFDSCLYKMENETILAISPPISTVCMELFTLLFMRLQAWWMPMFLEALFPLTHQHLLRGQSVRTFTMPGCFRYSALEPTPHSFTAFTASMSQKAHFGTRDAVEYAALVPVRNQLEGDR